ncbi:hypothetical protein D3C71_2167320 [compost metagenome]
MYKVVAPRVGAWIEIAGNGNILDGVKQVAPRAGAWIEINRIPSLLHVTVVAPRAGAWIEIHV